MYFWSTKQSQIKKVFNYKNLYFVELYNFGIYFKILNNLKYKSWQLQSFRFHRAVRLWYKLFLHMRSYKKVCIQIIHSLTLSYLFTHILLMRCFNFVNIIMIKCAKSSQLFITASTCDTITSRQISWFSDFIYFF